MIRVLEAVEPYLLSPSDFREMFRVNARLVPLNVALTTFALLYHFHIGG